MHRLHIQSIDVANKQKLAKTDAKEKKDGKRNSQAEVK
jgi:hypothetical protein